MRIFRSAILLAASMLAACNPPSVAKHAPLPVQTEVAKITPYSQTLSLTGEIAARVSSNLSFRVSGRVIARNVDVGAHVEAGDTLARLDPTSALADLDSAKASVVSAEAVLKNNSVTFDRQRQLLDTGFTTRSNFETAQQNMRTAQGSLDSAKAQAATAEDALTFMVLKAGRAGVITARQIEVGQVTQAAQTVFTLAEDGPRDAVFDVYESILFARPAGNVIRLSLVTDPSVVGEGHVRETSPNVNAKTGTVTVKLEIDKGADKMPLGAAVIGRGAFEPRKVVHLPWTAAASDGNNLAVWVVDPASRTVSLKPVIAVAYDNRTLLIGDGLSEGDAVVTEGGKFLYPGEVVAPQEASP